MSANDSDPLPFMQLDRSAKAKAAMLAGATDLTFQHALGSLISFWDMNGDPREIERLLDAGETAIVLDGPELALRFKIASGKDVDPSVIARCGFAEPVGDKYRVRGMSRFFEPIQKRRQARSAASAGGKASVEARRAKTGSARPQKSFEAPFDGRSSGIQAEPEAVSKRLSKRSRSDSEAEIEAPSNLEDRGQRSDPLKTLAGKPADDGWQDLVNRLDQLFLEVRGQLYSWGPSDFGALKNLIKKGNTHQTIALRWERGLRGTFAREVHSVTQLASATKWNALAGDVAGAPIDEHTGFSTKPATLAQTSNPLELGYRARLAKLDPYVASQLAHLKPERLDGGVLVLSHHDPLFVEWCSTEYLPSLENVRIELKPKTQTENP